MRTETLIPELAEPFELFGKWLLEAEKANLPQWESMVLSTATSAGVPSARVVLLKNFIENEGEFWFFTNYQSQKGHELLSNPNAHLLFYWEPFGRQVRVSGKVSQLSAKHSDEYFQSRPLDSQIGASISDQSRPLSSYSQFVEKYYKAKESAQTIPPKRPEHWGGFKLVSHAIEYWLNGEHRLHERLKYARSEGNSTGWNHMRLWP